MWFVMSLLGLMEFIYYGFIWILFTLSISTVTWIACGARKPVGQTPPQTPAANNSKENAKTACTTATTQQPTTSEIKNVQSDIQFTPSQQEVIDAELKAALNAEKKDKEAKILKEKTIKEKKPVKNAHGGMSPKPMSNASVLKPISLGNTKQEILKNPTDPKGKKPGKTPAKTPGGAPLVSPARSPARKKEESGKATPKKITTPAPSKPVVEATPAAVTPMRTQRPAAAGKNAGSERAAGKKAGSERAAGKKAGSERAAAGKKGAVSKTVEAPKETPPVVDDGRSGYVGQAPDNLVESAYVKPDGK